MFRIVCIHFHIYLLRQYLLNTMKYNVVWDYLSLFPYFLRQCCLLQKCVCSQEHCAVIEFHLKLRVLSTAVRDIWFYALKRRSELERHLIG